MADFQGLFEGTTQEEGNRGSETYVILPGVLADESLVDERNQNCGICRSMPVSPEPLPCGHIFCGGCLVDAREGNTSSICSVCHEAPITAGAVHEATTFCTTRLICSLMRQPDPDKVVTGAEIKVKLRRLNIAALNQNAQTCVPQLMQLRAYWKYREEQKHNPAAPFVSSALKKAIDHYQHSIGSMVGSLFLSTETAVTLTGIKSRPDLNGMKGIVQAFLRTNQRYCAKLADGSEFSFGEDNLALEEEEKKKEKKERKEEQEGYCLSHLLHLDDYLTIEPFLLSYL